MTNIDIMSTIQNEARKRENTVDTDNEIDSEYKELAIKKRPTFDVPYTEVDPLR